MELDKKRERQIKMTIYLISFFLLAGIIAILFWTNTIQFDWSNELKKSYSYENNKSKERRVLIIGDSQLEKWTQINCLHKEIENFCEKNDLGHVSVAHHGFGPIEYLDQLTKVAHDYKPNLIVLFYYTGNDLTDVMLRSDYTPKINTHPPYITDNTEHNKTETEEEQKPAKRQEVSNLEEALAKFDWKSFEEKGIDPLMIEYAKNRIRYPSEFGPEYVNPYVLNMAVWNDNYLIDNNMMLSIKAKGTWYKILKRFEGILQVSEEIGAEICFVSIPSTVQVDTSHFPFYKMNKFKTPNELNQANAPQQLLGEFSKASNIKYIDLLPLFKKHSKPHTLYLENDDHLTGEGHEYAFTFVKKDILQPFLEGKSQEKKDRASNYYEKYIDWAVADMVTTIKSDSAWYALMEQKAAERDVSVDVILLEDATYLIEKGEY